MNRLPHPRLLAAALAACALALGLIACGDDDGGGDAGAQEVLESASLRGIESADLDLALDVRSRGETGGDLTLRVSGPFQGGAEGDLPQLDMSATVDGAVDGRQIDFDGGLVLLPNSAYVEYEGVQYEVDPTTFGFVESAIGQGEREAGGEAGPTACQEEIGGLEIGELVEGAKSEGSVAVGGVETSKVSGELDVAGALDALLEVARSPACRAQAAAAGELPSDAEIEDARGQIEDAVRSARVELYVGEGIVRRLVADVTLQPQDGGGGRVEIDLDLRLAEVNEEQRIAAPQGRSKPLSDLFIELGVNPIELLGLLQGEAGSADLGNLLEGLGGPAR